MRQQPQHHRKFSADGYFLRWKEDNKSLHVSTAQDMWFGFAPALASYMLCWIGFLNKHHTKQHLSPPAPHSKLSLFSVLAIIYCHRVHEKFIIKAYGMLGIKTLLCSKEALFALELSVFYTI